MVARGPLRVAAIAAFGLVAWGGDVGAGNPHAYEPAAPETLRAVRYATMSNTLCFLELAERGVPFEHVERAPGVEGPIRLTGPVRGVHYVQTWREEMDPRAPATVLDCRLGLALDDMSRILAEHGVVEVAYLSMWRPGRAHPGRRHPAGRAIDVATVRLAGGRSYRVDRDFQGRVGGQTCGHGAAPPRRDTDGARFWRAVVCALDRERAFNLVLTPQHDWGHRDHLHLEVRSGIRWFLTQ